MRIGGGLEWVAEVELMKRGSGYILKVGATRTCYKLNVGGERKSQVKDVSRLLVDRKSTRLNSSHT